MTSSNPPKLFQPIKVGDVQLQHHIVLAPLTRLRANAKHVHGDLALDYYTQRASTPGTLLISEGTSLRAEAGGWSNEPHIHTDEQVAGWKRITDAVHAKGSYMFCQIFAHGRAAYLEALEPLGYDIVGPSPIPIQGRPTPRELTVKEIKEYVCWFAEAAHNAVHRAGFDGVEVHFANGYLLNQFIDDGSNHRTDEYGGSIENRCRFPLEVLDAVVKTVGQSKVAFRVSPWEIFQDMGMKDPVPTYTYLIKKILEDFPLLAYLHAIERRVKGVTVAGSNSEDKEYDESKNFLRQLWKPRPFISAGLFNRETALERAETEGDLIAFGRLFISNPDLPLRLKKNLPLTPYNRETFYVPESPVGYIDYPFYTEEPVNGVDQ
ncbi:NADH:flavin oxidoreductase/NADH oxidase [Abortiporus biennis]|nr:NADH:flavin oxidoreductase/NADH oxidase [Abortiporus biennis]